MSLITDELKRAENLEYKKYERDYILDLLMNYSIIDYSGNSDKKINEADIIPSNFDSQNEERQKELLKDAINNLNTRTNASQQDLSILTLYGNLWKFITSDMEKLETSNNRMLKMAELPNFLLTPKLEKPGKIIQPLSFSGILVTKREIEFKYEEILNSALAGESFTLRTTIFKDLYNELFDIGPTDSYVKAAKVPSANLISYAEEGYSVFRDWRDEFLLNIFTNRLFYINEMSLSKYFKLIANLVLEECYKKHDEYTKELDETLSEELKNLGKSIIDLSKIFDKVIGNYKEGIYTSYKNIEKVLKEINANKNFDITDEKNKEDILSSIKTVLNNLVTIGTNEKETNIKTQDDIRNFIFVNKLMSFIKISNNSSRYNRITTLMTNIEADCIEFRRLEATIMSAAKNSDSFLVDTDFFDNYIILYS